MGKKDGKEKKRFRSIFYFEGNRYETESSKSQKEADQKAAIKKDKLKRGEVGISGDMTVRRWAEEWLEIYKKPFVGDSTYEDYVFYTNIILNEIGSMKLKTVSDIHLQKILNSYAGKSESYLTKLHITICAIFRKAYTSKPRLIPLNPADDLDIPAAESGSYRSITDYERKAILQTAESHHSGLWVKTMLYTGLRPGEIRALDWRHIDFTEKLVHVEKAMKAGTTKIGSPKSDAGVRDIPIRENLFQDLKKARGGPFEPVFTQITTGNRHTISSMKKSWASFKKELDINMGAKFGMVKAKDGKMRLKQIISVVAADLVPYCLRHTFGTDLQDAGVPLNVARYLMGHADVSTTSKVYIDTTKRSIQDAARKMNDYDPLVGTMVGKTSQTL